MAGFGAAHLQDDVHAVAVGHRPDRSDDVARGVEDHVGAERLGHRAPLRVDVGREDARRAGQPADRDRHEPDRPAAGHEHRLAGDLLDERGQDGIAHRFLDGRDLRREPLTGPDVAHRQDDVFGERAVGVDAQDPQVAADVRATRPALVARAVDEVRLGGDQGSRDDRGRRPGPYATTRPAISWPKICGSRPPSRPCAHGSQR